MVRVIVLRLLAVCFVWQASATPAIILRRLHPSTATVTSNNHRTARPKKAPVTNPSVSLSMILKDLESSNVNPMAASDKNSSESPFVTPKNRVHRQRSPRRTPDKNQSTESPFVTFENQEYRDNSPADSLDENQSKESTSGTLKSRDYSKGDTKEASDAEWTLEESSESPLHPAESQENNDVDEEPPAEGNVLNKQSLLSPAEVQSDKHLQLLLKLILLEPELDVVIRNFIPIQMFNCTASKVHKKRLRPFL